MTNAQLATQLVSLLQAHRDTLTDAAWESLDGTPLMDALDGLADLEYAVEEQNYVPAN